MFTPEKLFFGSLLALLIPMMLAALANLDPCPDDELLEKTAPFFAVMGIAGILGMLWSGWLAIKPMFG